MRKFAIVIFSLAICLVISGQQVIWAEGDCPNVATFQLENQKLWYLRSNVSANELWYYDFADAQAVDTGMQIPLTLSVALNTNNFKLAYIDSHPLPEGLMLEIVILDINTLEQELSLQIQSTEMISRIGLRWISDSQLRFVSNSSTQQYTIVNTDGDFRNYALDMPIETENTIIWYNTNYSYAVYIDRNEDVRFIDLERLQFVDQETTVVIPSRSIETYDFDWALDNQNFLFMAEDDNWFAYNILDDALEQITDVGSQYLLRTPVALSPEKIAFVGSEARDSRNYDMTAGVWMNNDFISTCVTENRILSGRWDQSGRYWSFIALTLPEEITTIHVFDTDDNTISEIVSLDGIDQSMTILGWSE